jgi:hypothetical protein
MEGRLKKLERWNRVLFVGLVLAFAPWILGAGATVFERLGAQTIKAKTIGTETLLAEKVLDVKTAELNTIVADNVGSRSYLFVDKDGKHKGGIDSGVIMLSDSNNKPRLMIAVKDRPIIQFYGEDGEPVATMGESGGKFVFEKAK